MGKTKQQRMNDTVLKSFIKLIRSTGALVWQDDKCLYIQQVGSLTARIPFDEAVDLAIGLVLHAEGEGKGKPIRMNLSQWAMYD